MMPFNELLKIADSYKEKISDAPPLPILRQEALDSSTRIQYIHNSGALEGGSLSLSETKTLLGGGGPVTGRTLEESQITMGHAAAYDYMLKTAKEKGVGITEETIKTMHRLIYQEADSLKAGQYRTTQPPQSDSGYLPSPPDEIPRYMGHLADQIRSSQSGLHPIELAAMVNKRFVDIQPFDNGNGLIARLLMNLVLVGSGYFVVSIHAKARDAYLKSMRDTRRLNDMEPFSMNIALHVKNSGENYFHQF